MVTVDLLAMLIIAVLAMAGAGTVGLLTGLKIGRMQGIVDAMQAKEAK